MERQQSRRSDAFRMSRLGWFLMAMAILFLGSLLIPPLERSDISSVLIYLVLVAPPFFGLNWLSVRYERDEDRSRSRR